MNATSQVVPIRWRFLAAFAAALLAAVPVWSQTAGTKKSTPRPGEYSLYEVNPFVGYQWFQITAYSRDTSRVSEFDPGLVLGLRLGENFWNYVGAEQSFTAGFNNMQLRPF